MKTSPKLPTPAQLDAYNHEMASALEHLEVGFQSLGRAILHSAQARAAFAMLSLKGRLMQTESGVEALIARVPAVGPMVAMSMYRATHADERETYATRPSNIDDGPEMSWPSLYPYLDEIGLRPA